MAANEDYASDVSDSEAAMAAMMGFNTFGSKNPPAKKRKFNSATDAFVEGDELSKIDKGGRKGQGSGGNEVPLGKTRVLGMRSRMENKEEINLDDDEDGDEDRGVDVRGDEEVVEGDDDAPRYMDTSLPPPAETGLGYNPRIMQLPGYQRAELDPYKDINNHENNNEEDEDDDDGPRYIDTSLPPPIEDNTGSGFLYSNTTTLPQNPAPPLVDDEEAREMQTRIDAILASIQPPPGKDDKTLSYQTTPQINSSSQLPPGISTPSQSSLPSFHPQTRPPGLPPGLPPKPSLNRKTNPDSSSTSHNSNSNSNNRGGSNAGTGRGGSGRGERNPHWYIGYYDHSFNENPWEKLEAKLGLEPVGTWLRRPPPIGGGGGS